jgi:cytochrome c553
VYLAYVQTSVPNGKGPGSSVARGKQLYQANRCQRCHGLEGEGDEAMVYPVVAAQHYAYTLREMLHIQEGSRSNAHPEMAKVLQGVALADIEAMADYLSSLPDYRSAAAGAK